MNAQVNVDDYLKHTQHESSTAHGDNRTEVDDAESLHYRDHPHDGQTGNEC